MKPLPPEKQEFSALINRACCTSDPTVRENKKSGYYSEKKIGQHRTAGALQKRSDKSPHLFLRHFIHATKIGPARKNEEYVPAMIPIISVKEKYFNVSPPKK